MKATAFKWAAMLCTPEYRDGINPKIKKKIENIARKPYKDEPKDKQTPCPFCGALFGEHEHSCPNCFSHVPFCITTGT